MTGDYTFTGADGPAVTEWEELAAEVGGSPFLQPGWIRAWWRAFGGGSLELHTLRRAGRLVAVLPLEPTAFGRSSPTNFDTPEFGILAVDREAAGTLAASVLERDHAAGRRVLERTLQRSPYLEIAGDVEAQVRERLGSKSLSELRRRRRRLEERGQLELEVADGTERLEGLLAEGYALEGSGWKTAAGSSIAARPDARQFYDEVARWAADLGILRLCFLRMGGKPIAFKLGLEADGAF